MPHPIEATHAPSSPWSTVARRLLLDRQARHWMRAVDPTWALGETRARVVRVVRETADVKTFVLAPNRHWSGHRAGQHTLLEATIDGVRLRRCFSIASPPSAEHLELTIKRVPGGRVTGWLHDRLRPGDVVGLGPAQGDFVLPALRPEALLFVTGGSGITPVLAMLAELAERGALHDTVLVHFARSSADIIARERLEGWAARHPGLRLELRTDDQPGPQGFDPETFLGLVPDFAQREAWLCGPPGLMARAEALWAEHGAHERLRRERFTAPVSGATEDGAAVTVTLTRSGRTRTLDGRGSLLEQLERAGERPAHGCRMGICQSCRCTKRSGVTRDRTTGELSSEPEPIRLCVSTPRSDLELDL